LEGALEGWFGAAVAAGVAAVAKLPTTWGSPV
jgi:hypothetical protein